MTRRATVIGNCQAEGIAGCMRALSPGLDVGFLLHDAPFPELPAVLRDNEFVFVQPALRDAVRRKHPEHAKKLIGYPPILFPAFHPDLLALRQEGAMSPMGTYHSALVLFGYQRGLGVDGTMRLFDRVIYEHLEYFDYWDASHRSLLANGTRAELALDRLVATWTQRGCFMHSLNHPKLFVLADLAKALLAKAGLPAASAEIAATVPDVLLLGPVWPVYPEIAERWGFEGSMLFKIARRAGGGDGLFHALRLEQFVAGSFARYDKAGGAPHAARLDQPRYQDLLDVAARRRPAAAASQQPEPEGVTAPAAGRQSKPRSDHPYAALPDSAFWRRAVESVPKTEMDPVVGTGFMLKPSEKIATAGSCFAQHISRNLRKRGFNYYVIENAPVGMLAADAERHGFGTYSARYGNIYTARQLLQLFNFVYGSFSPVDRYWVRDDGRYCDPFRPQIEPDGFDSVDAVEASRLQHHAAVRAMFETLDTFVFTLGLTEAWESVADGAVFPLAPGVAGGRMSDAYRFHNFDADEVATDLRRFIRRLRRVNTGAKIILTVSPVPLIATYENRHVLVSTTYSKSVLRVAAESAAKMERVDYFPSYEIVTGGFNRGSYFARDFRSVTDEGVAHVMRIFFKHYFGVETERPAARNAIDDEVAAEIARVAEILCDEEALDA